MPRKIRVGLAGLGSIAQRGILPHTFQADAREKIEASGGTATLVEAPVKSDAGPDAGTFEA